MGRSISKVEIRFKGGSGEDGFSSSSRGLEVPPEASPRLRTNVLVLSGFKFSASVADADGLRLELVARGAEETLRPFGTLEGPLFFLRLADRGIFHVEGDGDGNMSAIENERLEFGSCLLLGSTSALGLDGGIKV